MKNCLLLFLISFSFSASAQIVSGIYLGKLQNDSNKKIQNYELALSEYRGKITGYAYTTFVSNDTFYYSIKKIKATRTEKELIVEDDKMIINNFPESPAKGVRQVNTIQLTNEDTLRQMKGGWHTTKTKVYYALTGDMKLMRDADSSRSALIGHLRELNIIGNDNYGNTASGDNRETRVAKNTKSSGSKGSKEKNQQAGKDQAQAVVPQVQETMSKSNGQNETGIKQTVAGNNTSTETVAKETSSRETLTKNSSSRETIAKETSSKETAVTGSQQEESKMARNASAIDPLSGKSHSTGSKTSVMRSAPPIATPYELRGKNQMPVVEVSSDSLVLAFYDNGVIDGDSISVYVNGQAIVSHTRLTATATKKTIYIGKQQDVQLLLVAENLGSLPPNTGLLVIRDGDNNYQLNFSADLQTNAAVTIRKKKSD
jgi:hypothetical protein